MRFKKRISHVDATQWFAEGDHERVERHLGMWVVATPEGLRSVKPGDWILCDECSNCWPMDGDLFMRYYEPVSD